MEEALQEMLEIFDDNQEDNNTTLLSENQAIEWSIIEITLPKVIPLPIIPSTVTEAFVFNKDNNVLNDSVREIFRLSYISSETPYLTELVPTTNTMSGYITNVEMYEYDLIDQVLPDEDIVAYKCNYGVEIYEGYTEPIDTKKPKRGRKKNMGRVNRKKQGSGKCFNSQLTFIIRSRTVDVLPDGRIPEGSRVYKFKVFRPGVVQLPGVRQEHINDVVECAYFIERALNFNLHPGETDPTKISRLVNLEPVMKNYKFTLKLGPGQIIKMKELFRVLKGEQGNPNLNSPKHPPLFMVSYGRHNVAVCFSTPTTYAPEKTMRVNIFMRGKINILGALNDEYTYQVYYYLDWLFATYGDTIIVIDGLYIP
jgi:hypothetical protein